MANIYDQHTAAFAKVSAFVIMDGAEHVATIAIKFPRDGAGRLYAYVHWLGTRMVRGHANGFGYDKRSAACSVAARKMCDPDGINKEHPDKVARYDVFRAALAIDDGMEWHNRLRDAGFTVLQAV